jgi:hypothetical protein
MKLVDTIILEQDEIIDICIKHLEEYYGIKFNYNIKIEMVENKNTGKYQLEFITNEKEVDIEEDDYNDVACDTPRGM